jgi:uncharacterized protein (UPF0332 family)
MTDSDALFDYRWNLAEETLDDARKFHASGGSPRSVVNRAYYAMFYTVLSLFIKTGIQARTSKHSTIISVFDTQFIKTGKLPRDLSRMLHSAFDDRQEYDYKDFVQVDTTDADATLADAEPFINSIREYLNGPAMRH